MSKYPTLVDMSSKDTERITKGMMSIVTREQIMILAQGKEAYVNEIVETHKKRQPMTATFERKLRIILNTCVEHRLGYQI
jgi:6-phosphogluconolactonase/glucosamine-6-phosphate isomerase/deaminase